MQVGSKDMTIIVAFQSGIKGVAIAMNDTSKRMFDMNGLSAVVFKANKTNLLSIQIGIDYDIADTAAFAFSGFGIVGTDLNAGNLS